MVTVTKTIKSARKTLIACAGDSYGHSLCVDGFKCSACGGCQSDHDGVLEMTFDGWGNRGLIDTFGEGPKTTYVCSACAKEMIDMFPWIGESLRGLLNINYAHTCLDGTIQWGAQSKCLADFDKHGWRKVYLVKPATRRSGNGQFYYRAFDAEDEALSACEALNRNVTVCRVVEIPVGNLHHYTRISLDDKHSESDWA